MAMALESPPRVARDERAVPVLLADDRQFEREVMSGIIRAIFAKHKVPLDLIAVETGENAANALFGEEFNSKSPTSGTVRQAPRNFRLAVLDNQMPHREGTPPLDDEGIRVAHDLRARLPTSPVSLIASSGDHDQTKFEDDFHRVLKKGSPMATISQAFEELGVFDLGPPALAPSKMENLAGRLRRWVSENCCSPFKVWNSTAPKSLED